MTASFPYIILKKQQIIKQINSLAVLHTPFLFIVDYKAEQGYIIKQNELDDRFVRFERQEHGAKNKEQGAKNKDQRTESQEHETQNRPSTTLRGHTQKSIEDETLNRPSTTLRELTQKSIEDETRNTKPETIQWQVLQISLEEYRPKFDYVVEQIHLGNSFLINLTQPTEVKTNLSLLELYLLGSAKYKLWLKDQFTVLSPETFVRIEGRTISSYPMKGTIDVSIPNAEEIILNDPKEKAEHATIVDLIRNDLSLVAENVEVKRYRYIDKLKTNKQDLLQVSSEISGCLPENYLERLGDILFSLLPAGSISGAPKPKTLEIIENAEGYERGFYTGICGWFDGENLDSAVMIRFIEKNGDKLIFKSGGGVTAQSDLQKEYEELIQKVYVPIY